MIKRVARKMSIDAQVYRAMEGRIVAVGAIPLAKELEMPWRVVARALGRLAEQGKIIEEKVVVRVAYRWGGETTKRYRCSSERTYPAWLEPHVAQPRRSA